MALLGVDDSSDNELVADGTDLRDNYDSLQSPLKAAGGAALIAGLGNPALLPVGVAAGAMTGQFDNMGDAYALSQGTSISTAWDAYNQIQSGDWASAITSIVAVGADVFGAMVDPIAAVAGQLAGWMMEHLEPLRMVLHGLTGNPDMVGAYGQTWTNIAGRMTQQRTAYEQRVLDETAGWQGLGGDAYKVAAGRTIEMCAGAAIGAAGLSEAATKMKDVVGALRSLVRDLIADLVGELVSIAIRAATVVLAPSAVATALAQIAKVGIKVADGVTRLALVISRLAIVLVDLGQAIAEIMSIDTDG